MDSPSHAVPKCRKNEWVLLFDYMYVVICTPFYNCVTTGPLQQQQKLTTKTTIG